jgi:hypothetical protein
MPTYNIDLLIYDWHHIYMFDMFQYMLESTVLV